MRWYARACQACHGDLHDDLETPGSAICLMCGRTYPTTDLTPTLQSVNGISARFSAHDDDKAPPPNLPLSA